MDCDTLCTVLTRRNEGSWHGAGNVAMFLVPVFQEETSQLVSADAKTNSRKPTGVRSTLFNLPMLMSTSGVITGCFCDFAVTLLSGDPSMFQTPFEFRVMGRGWGLWQNGA